LGKEIILILFPAVFLEMFPCLFISDFKVDDAGIA